MLETLLELKHKSFEKCGLVSINRQVLYCIPSVVGTKDIACHVDKALLKKNGGQEVWGQTKEAARGEKVPTEQSFSEESQASEDKESELGDNEVVTDEKEVVDDVDEEEVENKELPDLEVVGPRSSRMGSHIVAAYHGKWYLD
jgi:hypothetical protein